MLTLKEVEKIAGLARLELQESEKGKLAEDLSNVLGYVQKLQEVNIEKVEPLTGGTNLKNVVREDEEKSTADDAMKIDILSAAPNREDDYFKVPSILE